MLPCSISLRLRLRFISQGSIIHLHLWVFTQSFLYYPLYRFNLFNNSLIRHMLESLTSYFYCLLAGRLSPSPTFWLVIILMLTDTSYWQCSISFHTLKNECFDYLLLFSIAYFFFNSSSFSLLSSSFSANSCFNALFSFSNSLIRFRCWGVIPCWSPSSPIASILFFQE